MKKSIRINVVKIKGPMEIQLTLSLPNATVVEFTVHFQTQLQSKGDMH